MAVNMTAFWDNSGTVIPSGLAEYVVAEQPIAEYDNWFNYEIASDMQKVIDDVINKFNANTILKADTNNTPVALTVGTNTMVGRASGSISALTMSEVRGILNVEDGATADQTNNEIRDAVEAATDSNTFTDADHTKLGGIDDGADVTGNNVPQSHGAYAHTDRLRTFFVGNHRRTNGGTGAYGIELDPDTDEYITYRFRLPDDYVALSAVKIAWMALSYTTIPQEWILDIDIQFASVGEFYDNTHTYDDGNVVTVSNISRYQVFSMDTSCFSGVSKDDFIDLRIDRDANNVLDTFLHDIVMIGVQVEYIADM